MDDDGQGCEFHLPAFDLFAQILGGASHHQSADKDGQDRIQDYVHQANAFAAEYTVEHHMQKWNQPAQRRQGIMHIVDGSGGKGCSHRGE